MSVPYVLLTVIAAMLVTFLVLFLARLAINRLTLVRRDRRYSQPRVRTRCRMRAAR